MPFVQTAGPALERKGDIAAFLTALEPRSVFFVDEIHRLPRTLEETFYPAMEDHRLPITVGQGAGARVVTLELPPFTLVGATTRDGPADDAAARPLRHPGAPGALRAPTSSRAIVTRSARDPRRSTLEEERRAAIAARSRGTPRVANRLLKRVRDYAEVRMDGVVSADAAHGGARAARGRRARASTASTGRSCARSASSSTAVPSGLSTLAVAVGEEQDTIEDVYEPYLLQRGPDQAHAARARGDAGRVRAPRPRAAAAADASAAVLSGRAAPRPRGPRCARRPSRRPARRLA